MQTQNVNPTSVRAVSRWLVSLRRAVLVLRNRHDHGDPGAISRTRGTSGSNLISFRVLRIQALVCLTLGLAVPVAAETPVDTTTPTPKIEPRVDPTEQVQAFSVVLKRSDGKSCALPLSSIDHKSHSIVTPVVKPIRIEGEKDTPSALKVSASLTTSNTANVEIIALFGDFKSIAGSKGEFRATDLEKLRARPLSSLVIRPGAAATPVSFEPYVSIQMGPSAFSGCCGCAGVQCCPREGKCMTCSDCGMCCHS